MQEVTIILQTLSTKKPIYAQKILRQIHILDTIATNPIFKEAYITNALVNLQGLPFIFDEMDLLLEHQNGEFKWFWFDRGLFLQETDKIF